MTKLNGIYGDSVFAASDEVMTQDEAVAVLYAMGCKSDVLTADSSTAFTRSTA